MKKIVISLCFLLSLLSVPAIAAPDNDDQVPKAVIAQAEQETGGRVLNAEVTASGYQLKVLMPGGRVRIIEVPRQE